MNDFLAARQNFPDHFFTQNIFLGINFGTNWDNNWRITEPKIQGNLYVNHSMHTYVPIYLPQNIFYVDANFG